MDSCWLNPLIRTWTSPLYERGKSLPAVAEGGDQLGFLLYEFQLYKWFPTSLCCNRDPNEQCKKIWSENSWNLGLGFIVLCVVLYIFTHTRRFVSLSPFLCLSRRFNEDRETKELRWSKTIVHCENIFYITITLFVSTKLVYSQWSYKMTHCSTILWHKIDERGEMVVRSTLVQIWIWFAESFINQMLKLIGIIRCQAAWQM